MAAPAILLIVLGGIVLIVVVILAAVFLLAPLMRALAKGLGNVFTFIGREIADTARLVGAIITAAVLIPLVIANILIGRWSASAHYGRSIGGEFAAMGGAVYRVLLANPARLFGLGALTEGIERRVPDAVARAPGPDKPRSGRTGQFEGYTIVGSLPGGGSGGKLYVARPDEIRLAAFTRSGQEDVDRVVIKVFSLKDGSSLPQIVRESRSLDAAKKLGLVLDHELTDERFYYVMRYVPGDSLGVVTQRMHAASGADGLDEKHLREASVFISDLLVTLDKYHRGGLWHKDVKPDNIIVDAERRAHLVDFGLVTPLRSAMTLTTHGTEYFRDPELVRMALRGVKVHQVDGAKFDVYAAGAVLYAIVENSFPAHGVLSPVSKRCPEALRWIIRRAMADYDKRYAGAAAMLADLRVVASARDPFAIKPADLPSFSGDAEPEPAPSEEDFTPFARAGARAASPTPRDVGAPAQAVPGQAGAEGAAAAVGAPLLRVANWWTGRYERAGDRPADRGAARSGDRVAHVADSIREKFASAGVKFDVKIGRVAAVPGAQAESTPRAAGARRPAHEQLASARARADAARARVGARMDARRRSREGNDVSGINAGVVVAVLLALGAVGGIGALAMRGVRPNVSVTVEGASDPAEDMGFAGAEIEPPEPVERIDVALNAPQGMVIDASTAPRGVGQNAMSLALQAGLVMQQFLLAPSSAGGEMLASVVSVQRVEDGRVLILTGGAPGEDANPAEREAFEAVRRRVMERGFTVFSREDASEGDDSEWVELESAARRVRALRPIDAPEVADALRRWLTGGLGAADGLDAVVWVEMNADADEPRLILVTPDATPDASNAERVARSMRNLVVQMAVFPG
ncbi:MAG: hypothetical protein RBS39_09990 [Phycisphaerales bacterium]|jgi:serine/threonine protein kinase|nr:hypothetical protein [Phycisphaerales bacterium]